LSVQQSSDAIAYSTLNASPPNEKNKRQAVGEISQMLIPPKTGTS
jgi:hypothetical protein